MLTVQRGESGGVFDVASVGRVSSAKRVIEEWHRRRAGWPGLGDFDWCPHVLQEAPNDRGVVDEGDQGEASATAGTSEHVQAQATAH